MTKKAKELDSQDFHIAELIARGLPESEILRVYGKSRSSLQRLKGRDDFQALVCESKRGLKTAIAKGSRAYAREQHLEKLEKFRQDGEMLGAELLKTSSMLLDLINQKLEIVQPADLSMTQLSNYLKSACLGLDSGFDLTSRSLGVERMMQIFNSVSSEE